VNFRKVDFSKYFKQQLSLQVLETRKEFETKKYSLLCFGPNLAELSSSSFQARPNRGPAHLALSCLLPLHGEQLRGGPGGSQACHLLLVLATRRPPLEHHLHATTPSLPFFLSLAALFFFPTVGLSLSFSRKTYSSPWPSTSAGVPCFPQPRRRSEKTPVAVLYLPVQGIDPRCLESPPSRIPHRKRAPPPPKFIVSGHPPAKATSPAGSR
jgi:hypothetical protein